MSCKVHFVSEVRGDQRAVVANIAHTHDKGMHCVRCKSCAGHCGAHRDAKSRAPHAEPMAPSTTSRLNSQRGATVRHVTAALCMLLYAGGVNAADQWPPAWAEPGECFMKAAIVAVNPIGWEGHH
eukprot:6214344-Pleurochrysis_carterae.AAC.4